MGSAGGVLSVPTSMAQCSLASDGVPTLAPCPGQAPGVGGGSSSCWHPWSSCPSCVLSAPGDFEYFGDATCPDEHRGFLLQKQGRFHLLASFWHPSMQRYWTMSFEPLEIKGLRRAVSTPCVWREWRRAWLSHKVATGRICFWKTPNFLPVSVLLCFLSTCRSGVLCWWPLCQQVDAPLAAERLLGDIFCFPSLVLAHPEQSQDCCSPGTRVALGGRGHMHPASCKFGWQKGVIWAARVYSLGCGGPSGMLMLCASLVGAARWWAHSLSYRNGGFGWQGTFLV